MKSRGRIAFLVAFLSLVFTNAFADEVRIPFGVYMDEFKSECKKNGLDLEGRRDSDGFVTDRASDFSVFAYRRLNDEELEVIKQVTWKTIRK